MNSTVTRAVCEDPLAQKMSSGDCTELVVLVLICLIRQRQRAGRRKLRSNLWKALQGMHGIMCGRVVFLP